MSSSMASSLLRRALRRSFSPSSLCGVRHQSSSCSSPLLRGVISRQTLTTKNPNSFASLRFFASSKVGADENLKQVLESEIQCAQEDPDSHGQESEIPKGFPFEIIDNPGDQTIILKRKFGGEDIQVTVLMNDADEVGDDEDDAADDNERNIEPSFSLVVNIDKGVGPKLEFSCLLSSEDLEIESMVVKSDEIDDEEAYQGPVFTDLDESLQAALHKYLKGRGLTVSLFDFLQEYMMKKDDREYLFWLKNMKEFVEK